MPRGQIGSLAYLVEETTTTEGGGEGRLLALIGDQGGELTVLDTRQGERPAHAAVLHPGGVLSGIRPMPGTPYVATCGADKRVLVLDARQGFTPVHELRNHTNFIYSLEVFGSMVLSGAGNGWLLVHDALTGDCCYGLGANTAAVRVIFASPTLMVAGGDDGKATVYDY
ncbi:unnamed protein product [Phytomonas sp. EM1]|nr:unnamed protein product [Phytomonas sp. EM1]|eukprot:CCW61661.1 unnamed protein product [Phytomonas sp. isolate EM1]